MVEWVSYFDSLQRDRSRMRPQASSLKVKERGSRMQQWGSVTRRYAEFESSAL